MSTEDATDDVRLTKGRRRLIACAMTSAAAMQGMDTFASAVALPEIRGVMSATIDEAAWILTSFLVASAIFTPLFAWLSRRFGARRLLLITTAAFFVCTLLVAQSDSLAELVAYRFLQGISAAGMGPLSHQVMFASYPREEYGVAISWLTAGRMSGVMIGPILGGLLTEYLSWRWIYYSNLPLCLFGFWLIYRYVPEDKIKEPPKFDFFGFILLSVAIGMLQLMLDRGERQNWFESTEIIIWAALGAAAFYQFVVHVSTTRNAYINPAIFANRDFLIGVFFIFILAIMVIGFAGLLPSLLQNHMNYPVSTAGLLGRAARRRHLDRVRHRRFDPGAVPAASDGRPRHPLHGGIDLDDGAIHPRRGRLDDRLHHHAARRRLRVLFRIRYRDGVPIDRLGAAPRRDKHAQSRPAHRLQRRRLGAGRTARPQHAGKSRCADGKHQHL